MVKGYFYLFGTGGNTKDGAVTGVPGECDGTVFMGFCKPKIRSEVEEGDWIIGISNAKIKPRKILSIIEVESKPKLHQAEKEYPEAIWSEDNPDGQIYVRSYEENDEIKYKYIEKAPHGEKDRENDMEKYPDTDVLIVGSENSKILGENGYTIDDKILSILKRDNNLENKEIDVNAPFGRDSRGRCQGRPQPAVVELNDEDIKLFKDIVKKRETQNEGDESLNCEGC